MEGLDRLRLEIDEIDKKIVVLFQRRMEIVSKVGAIKQENNLPILNAQREEDIIKKNIDYLNDKELGPYIEELYKRIMDLSKDYQAEKSNIDR